jgi:hypothetical protein
MTAQMPDILIYNGEEHALFSNPLEAFFGLEHPRPEFVSPHTANWRGYVATWEIKDGLFYLIGLEAWLTVVISEMGRRRRVREVGLSDVFPDLEQPILATWFTGKLHVPQGEMLFYIHMGYESLYERTLVLTVEQGRVVAEEVVDNRQSEEYRRFRFLDRKYRELERHRQENGESNPVEPDDNL